MILLKPHKTELKENNTGQKSFRNRVKIKVIFKPFVLPLRTRRYVIIKFRSKRVRNKDYNL